MIEDLQRVLGEISDKVAARKINERELEDRLLELIGSELENKQYDESSWLRAFSDAEGNNERAKALYVKYRLRRMKDQVARRQMESNAQLAAQSKEILVNNFKELDNKVGSFANNLLILAVLLLILVSGFVFVIGF